MRDKISRVENAGPENAGLKMQDWKIRDQLRFVNEFKKRKNLLRIVV